MKVKIKQGVTSKLVRMFVLDSTATDGSGKTGIAHDASGLIAYYFPEGDSSPTPITLASGTVGTWSSGGFKEVSASYMPGVYELGLPDLAVDATSEGSVLVMLSGATGMAPVLMELQLVAIDESNATSLGLTNLATAVSTPPTVGAIADAVLDEALSGHASSGTLGKAIGDGVTAWVTATGFNTTTPPTAASIADAVLDEALSGHTGSGTLGKAVGDGVAAWVTATGFNTTTPPTVGAIADAVLDEALSGHTGSGSLGKAIGDGVTAWVTATGFNTTTPPTVGVIADAVLDEALSGHTGSGTFGKAIGDGVTAWVTANIGGLNDLSAAQVNAQVDTALSDIHLDHLLAVDYDPSSKPGVVTALLNELVQNDGGVSQFTQNALEKGPSGGGSGGVVGSGSTAHEVTINAGGNPQDGAEVYVTTDSAGTNVVAGTLHTDAQGKATFQLDAATYYLWVQKAGVNFTNPTSFTVS